MIQWLEVEEQEYFNGKYKAKLYRKFYIPASTLKIEFKPEYGLDRYALDHLGSELFNYKMIDTNKVQIAECLGDLDRIKKIEVPVE